MPNLPAHNPPMAILAAATLTWGIVLIIYLAGGMPARLAIVLAARWGITLGAALAVAYLGAVVGGWPGWPMFLAAGAVLIVAGASSGYLPMIRRRIR